MRLSSKRHCNVIYDAWFDAVCATTSIASVSLSGDTRRRAKDLGDRMRPDIDFTLLARATDEVRSYKAGDVIFKEGDAGNEFFVVKRGSVSVRMGNRTLQTI